MKNKYKKKCKICENFMQKQKEAWVCGFCGFKIKDKKRR